MAIITTTRLWNPHHMYTMNGSWLQRKAVRSFAELLLKLLRAADAPRRSSRVSCVFQKSKAVQISKRAPDVI